MSDELLVGIGADFSAMEAARQRDLRAWKQWVADSANAVSTLTARINSETAKIQAAQASQLAAVRAKQVAYKTTLGIDAATMATQMPLQSWGSPTGEKSPAVGMRGLAKSAEQVAILLSGGLGAGVAVLALNKLSAGFSEARQRTAEFRKELEEVKHSQDFYGREGLGGIVGLQQQREAKMREMDAAHSANNADVLSQFYNPFAWGKYRPQSHLDWQKNWMGRQYDSQIGKMAEVQATAEEHKLSVIRAQAEGRALDAKWLETEYELTRKIAEANKLGDRGGGLASVLTKQMDALRAMSEREKRGQGLEQQAEYWREGVLRDASITSESARHLALLQAQLDAQRAITENAQTGLDRQRSKTKEAELELQITQAISAEAERKRLTRAQRGEDAAKQSERLGDLDVEYQKQMILNDRSTPFRGIRSGLFQASADIAKYEKGSFDPLDRAANRNRLAGDIGSLQDARAALINRPVIADSLQRIGGGGGFYAGANTDPTIKSIEQMMVRIMAILEPKTATTNAYSAALN